MKRMTDIMKNSLSKAGISIEDDGKLKLDEDTFKNADYDDSMEVFCFVPNIEVSLYPKGFPNKNGDVAELTDFMKKHLEELREVEIVKDMQSFIDEK